MNRNRFLAALLAALLSACLLLTACGGGGGESGSATEGTDAPAASETDMAGAETDTQPGEDVTSAETDEIDETDKTDETNETDEIDTTGETESERPPEGGTVTVTVTYRYGNGETDTVVTLPGGNRAVEPNDPIWNGHSFRFWARNGEETAYDFNSILDTDLVLVAVWETGSGETVRLRWSEDEVASFLFDGTTPRQVTVGETLRFRLWVSPYYTGEPVVMAGDQTATLGEDGYYSFTVREAVTVSISGLKRDMTPIRGLGTEKSPYIVTSASHLKMLADSIAAGEEKYVEAVIRLDADVDLRGETISPIGTATNCFSGTFDGNGHTVSNFRVDSSNGVAGFFGYVAEGTVKNLHIDTSFTVEASDSSYNYIIGGVVAYCISGDIQNCSFDGSVKVFSTLGTDNVCYVGGIVGFLQGYETDYTGTVSYCTVRAELTSVGDSTLTAIGGIAGAVVGTADSAPAYIHNTVFSGTVSGKTAVGGGIAGYLRDRAAIAACRSEGSISARNESDVAAAGALVGVADNESAVTNCISTASVEAVGADASAYETGDIVGIRYADANVGIDSRKCVILDSYYAPDGKVVMDGKTYDTTRLSDMTALLGWAEADWQLTEGALLPNAAGADEVRLPVHFEFGRDITLPGLDGKPLTQSRETVTIQGYGPLYWVFDGSGMNNFKADDGYISYGYFLDEACTQRLPASMVLTSEMTVYVGFADYSGIAGEYYAVFGDEEVKLTFDDNGKMTMFASGRLASYVYVFNGEHVLIRDSYFAYLAYPSLVGKGYDLTTDCYADPEGQALVLYDHLFFAKENGLEVRAGRENAAMGTWYTEDGDTYTFLSDGTGSLSSGGGFTYTCTNRTVTLKLGTTQIVASISADGLSMTSADRRVELFRTDAFAGTWESDFATRSDLVVDGRGTLTLNGQSYPYTVTDGVLSFAGGTLAYDPDGLPILTATDGTETVYGREGSFIGVWYETWLDYRMELYGIGKDGYGYGTDSNGVTFTYVVERSEDGSLSVSMYYRTTLYGLFNLATSQEDGSELLFLAVWTAASGMLVDDYQMCYMDPFCGMWHTEDGMTLDFNGLGSYNIDFHQGDIDWVAMGYVTVKQNGAEEQVRYTYSKATATATFTWGGKTYTVTQNGGAVEVNGEVVREPDGLELTGWRTPDGSILLTFNGKSHVGLGEATLTVGGESIACRYEQELTENGQIVRLYTEDGALAFTFTLNGGTHALLGDAEGCTMAELGMDHKLLGQTYLPGNGYELAVGTDMTADGVVVGYLGEIELTLVYVDETYLILYAEDTFLYYLGWLSEDCAVLMDESFEVVSVICHDDGLRGTYVAADGSILELDGRSAAAAYVYPSADLTREEDGETLREALTYRCEDGTYILSEIDRSGEEDVLVDRWLILTEAQDGATAYTAEDGRVIYLLPADA